MPGFPSLPRHTHVWLDDMNCCCTSHVAWSHVLGSHMNCWVTLTHPASYRHARCHTPALPVPALHLHKFRLYGFKRLPRSTTSPFVLFSSHWVAFHFVDVLLHLHAFLLLHSLWRFTPHTTLPVSFTPRSLHHVVPFGSLHTYIFVSHISPRTFCLTFMPISRPHTWNTLLNTDTHLQDVHFLSFSLPLHHHFRLRFTPLRLPFTHGRYQTRCCTYVCGSFLHLSLSSSLFIFFTLHMSVPDLGYTPFTFVPTVHVPHTTHAAFFFSTLVCSAFSLGHLSVHCATACTFSPHCTYHHTFCLPAVYLHNPHDATVLHFCWTTAARSEQATPPPLPVLPGLLDHLPATPVPELACTVHATVPWTCLSFGFTVGTHHFTLPFLHHTTISLPCTFLRLDFLFSSFHLHARTTTRFLRACAGSDLHLHTFVPVRFLSTIHSAWTGLRFLDLPLPLHWFSVPVHLPPQFCYSLDSCLLLPTTTHWTRSSFYHLAALQNLHRFPACTAHFWTRSFLRRSHAQVRHCTAGRFTATAHCTRSLLDLPGHVSRLAFPFSLATFDCHQSLAAHLWTDSFWLDCWTQLATLPHF